MLAEAVKTCRAYGAKLVLAKLDRAWNAMSAFANTGCAVAHVRGSYVPTSEVTGVKGWQRPPAAAMAARTHISFGLAPDDAALDPPARKPEPVDSPEQLC